MRGGIWWKKAEKMTRSVEKGEKRDDGISREVIRKKDEGEKTSRGGRDGVEWWYGFYKEISNGFGGDRGASV